MSAGRDAEGFASASPAHDGSSSSVPAGPAQDGSSRSVSASGTPVEAAAPVVEAGWLRVCPSEALAEGGDGVRFDWRAEGEPASQAAFAVRFDGEPRAYLNRCAHVPVELDWQPGRFFDESGLYLVCATHGAMYDAADGRCAGGPCRGRGLVALRAREADGWVWVSVGGRSDGKEG